MRREPSFSDFYAQQQLAKAEVALDFAGRAARKFGLLFVLWADMLEELSRWRLERYLARVTRRVLRDPQTRDARRPPPPAPMRSPVLEDEPKEDPIFVVLGHCMQHLRCLRCGLEASSIVASSRKCRPRPMPVPMPGPGKTVLQ